MFAKNLFKFEADTGSNGSNNGSNVDNTSQVQQEETKKENQEESTQIDLSQISDEQLSELAEKHGFVTSEKLDEIILNRQKRWEKDRQKDEERSKMSVKEQLALELEEIKQENERLKKESRLNAMVDSIKLDLNKSQLPYNDTIVEILINDDEEKANQNLDSFKTYLSEFKASIEEEVRKELRGATYQSFPKGVKSSNITKQDILAIQDIEKRQQVMAENLHLFN